MKKLFALLLGLILVFTMSSCSFGLVALTSTTSSTTSSTTVSTQQTSTTTSSTISVEYDSDDLNSNPDSSEITYITLGGDSITLNGTGAKVDGSIVTIMYARAYIISGTLNNGQIIVNTDDEETVQIVLNGVNITCSTSAPIYVIKSEKTVITLAGGTTNYVTDGKTYVFENSTSDEPNAAIFSNDDLTINGSGSLTVNANYNNGIQSKDDLKITGGNITVNAIHDGVKGRDSIAIKNGTLTVKSGDDGMQSNNDEKADKGYIFIEGGTINITAGTDGIQAETSLIISGGSITISSGGGSANSSSSGSTWGSWGVITNSTSSASAKGLKAGVDVTITGGTIKIDSSDDSIHSNGSLTINSGDIVLTSGDDGIHADSSIVISGGDINITKSYEGIESALITINGGNIYLISSDDGINVVGGMDGSSIGGRPGQNTFVSSGNNYLYINGGYIVINAVGDGLDINGPITMTGGKVIINGPTANNNGALDYTGSFKITGGYLLAIGSSGMAQAPSTSSTQYSVMLNLTSARTAKTMIHIETKSGEEILTFVPTNAYQSIVLCSPALKSGTTYVVYLGGSSTGTATDGLYSGGTYTAGAQLSSFTISSIVTTIGSSGGMGR